MTITSEPVALAVAARLVAGEAGCSVMCAEDLSKTLVAPVFTDVDAEVAFKTLARAANVAVELKDGVVVFRQKADARAIGVVDVGYSSEQFAEALQSVGEVKVSRLGDRVVVSGSEDEVQRVMSAMDALEVGPDGWELSVLVFEVSDELSRTLGVKLSPSLGGSIGVGVDLRGGTQPFTGVRAQAIVTALAEASDTGDRARLMTQGSLFLLEGRKSILQQGDVVPIPRKTVSDQGTVTTSGYDEKRTGFTFEASGQRVPGGVLLTLKPTLSSVVRYVDEAPVTAERSVEAVVALRSGEWVALSGLETAEWLRALNGVPGLGDSFATSHSLDRVRGSSVLLFVQARRVFSSAGLSSGSEPESLLVPPAVPAVVP